MPKKLMRCLRKVRRKGGVQNPMAVCIKATGQKPHRRKIRKKKG